MKAWVSAGLAAGLLAGCGGTSAEQPVAQPPPSSPATTTAMQATTTTTTTRGPSVAQFASVVAEQRASLDKLSDELEDCVTPASEIQGATCAHVIQRAPVEGSLTAKRLRAAGTPPPEISALMSRTLAAADGLAKVDVSTCTLNSWKRWLDECLAPRANSSFSNDQLLKVLAGWKPYGG
jgi:hypothetical protein